MTNEAAVGFLSQEWARAGVGKGDMLLLHSNTRGTLRRLKQQGFKMDLETILDSFLYALGEAGTLLLPLFNFDFCAGNPFDIRTTPSHMGALTETGRLRARRRAHRKPYVLFCSPGSAECSLS